MVFEEHMLKEVCSRIRSGKNISSKLISSHGKYKVFGGNGLRGFTEEKNFEGECAIVGRQGAMCGNVRFFRGEAYMTEHAIVICANQYNNTEYLSYILEKMKLGRLSAQSAQPGISVKTLSQQVVRLPSLEEQNKVVSILRPIEDKIALNKKINDNLEKQAQALFKSWFIDFEPFEERFIASPIGSMIPASLKMKLISDIPHILETGKRPKGGAVKSGIPSIGAENVKRLGEVNFASTKYIPYDFAKNMKRGEIKGYEVLLYKDGGKPGTFLPHFSMFGEGFPYEKFYINEHVFKLDFFDKGFNEFTYFYLQTDYPYTWLANNGMKAAIPGINKQDVETIWIYEPENIKVKEFCNWVQPLFKTILSNCAENIQLTKLRDGLLPKLMSDMLDLEHIEI